MRRGKRIQVRSLAVPSNKNSVVKHVPDGFDRKAMLSPQDLRAAELMLNRPVDETAEEWADERAIDLMQLRNGTVVFDDEVTADTDLDSMVVLSRRTGKRLYPETGGLLWDRMSTAEKRRFMTNEMADKDDRKRFKRHVDVLMFEAGYALWDDQVTADTDLAKVSVVSRKTGKCLNPIADLNSPDRHAQLNSPDRFGRCLYWSSATEAEQNKFKRHMEALRRSPK
jgi:hypothetical protein